MEKAWHIHLGMLQSKYQWRNVICIGVALNYTDTGFLSKSSRRAARTALQSWYFPSWKAKLPWCGTAVSVSIMIHVFQILMKVFRDYYILSGYSSLHMSPMMRAPELTAIGNCPCWSFRNLLKFFLSWWNQIRFHRNQKRRAIPNRGVRHRSARYAHLFNVIAETKHGNNRDRSLSCGLGRKGNESWALSNCVKNWSLMLLRVANWWPGVLGAGEPYSMAIKVYFVLKQNPSVIVNYVISKHLHYR